MVDPGYTGIFTQHLYYVFDATVGYENDAVRVNLSLNRVSSWLDVHSHLPYEGKLVVNSKTAANVSIRVPGLVTKRAVKSAVNGKAASAFWAGQYLGFHGLKRGDVLAIEFPMKQWTEHCTWRGYEDPAVPELYEQMNWVPR